MRETTDISISIREEAELVRESAYERYFNRG